MIINLKNFIMRSFITASLFCLAACAFMDSDSEPEPTMTINVDFREVHRCSRISPEITVAYAPKGTKFYDVRLVENGTQERFLGGGTWQEDGSGVIPEGALTKHYSGPCPSDANSPTYTYVVTAMESENSQPLEVRLFKWHPDD